MSRFTTARSLPEKQNAMNPQAVVNMAAQQNDKLQNAMNLLSTVTGTATTPADGPVVAYLPAGHAAEPPTEPQPSGAATTAQQQKMAVQGMVPSGMVWNKVAPLSPSAIGLTAAAGHAQITQLG